jgi:hypothetical protein
MIMFNSILVNDRTDLKSLRCHGGGATDFRITKGKNWYDFESLKSRIMVAGAGGGTDSTCGLGGNAGTLKGFQPASSDANPRAQPGTQTSGGSAGTYKGQTGKAGSFGMGGSGESSATDPGGSGGSGYFGGGGVSICSPGAGGSSFVSGCEGCNAILSTSSASSIKMSNQPNHYSGFIFKDIVMKGGNQEMPTPSYSIHFSLATETDVGNIGAGHARITYFDIFDSINCDFWFPSGYFLILQFLLTNK